MISHIQRARKFTARGGHIFKYPLNILNINKKTAGVPTFFSLITWVTSISENQGLEKSRFASNLRKISGPAHLDFFFSLSPVFFQVYGINLAFFFQIGGYLEKKSRFAGPEIFLRFEAQFYIQLLYRPHFGT